MPADTSSMKPRYAGKFSPYNGEQREIERGRHAIRQRQHAPGHLHGAADDEHQAEGEQQFGDMSVVVHAPEPPHLDRRADRAAQHRGQHEGRPEADPVADLIGEVGAEHVDAGMGEVQHAHHAEDQCEPARQHEQQHAVNQAIQQGDHTDLQSPPMHASQRAELLRCGYDARPLHLARGRQRFVCHRRLRFGLPSETGMFSTSYFYVFGEDRLVVRVQQLMVILAHDVVAPNRSFCSMPSNACATFTASVDPAWLIARASISNWVSRGCR